MTDKVRVGIIGTGQIAQTHLKNYASIPEVEVVACADIDAAALARTADLFKVPSTHADYRELLRRDDITAVDVCLHNNLHRPVTVAALEAGKHVYCEKPMAGSYADGKLMLDAARRTGKLLHIQLNTLYSNETRAAKELISQDELGQIYHARSSSARRRGRPYVDGYGSPSFVQKQHAAGGALYDMGVYHIAQLLYLLDNPPVLRVSGKTYQKIAMDETRRQSSGYDVEELGLGLVRFDGGVTLDIIEGWALHVDKLEGSTLFGSKAGLRLEPFGFFKSYGAVMMSSSADLGAARFRWDNVSPGGRHYASSQLHWAAALQGQVSLLPTAEIALNTLLISEGIYLSEALDREVTAEEVAAHSKPVDPPH